MERGRGDAQNDFFESMTQDIAEEIIPAESISKPLDATKFEHLKETTEERAEKLKKERENGTLPKKNLYQGFAQPVSIEEAIKTAQNAAKLATPTFEQPVRTKPPVKETTPVLQQVKSLFGKVSGFFKKNFGSSNETAREVRIQFPSTVESSERKPILKTAEEYMDAYFATHSKLQTQFEKKSKIPFAKFKEQQVARLEEKLKSQRAAINSGKLIDQQELDTNINKGIFSQLKTNEHFMENGSPMLELFNNPESGTVRIEGPTEESLEEVG